MLSGHPAFWILVAAVAAPLLGRIPIGFRVPTVIFEVLLGIVIGPQVLGILRFEGFVETMFHVGMAATLFMGGMELDFSRVKGRPLSLAIGGWGGSVLLGIAAVGVLHVLPQVHAPMMVTIALSTTGLGVLIPILRDGGQLDTSYGRLLMGAGTLGEVGPIVAMALVLSRRYGAWQEAGFLLVFLAVVCGAIAFGMGVRPPKVLAFLGRQMRASTQLPVRITLLVLSGLMLLAGKFGFERILGAFAAGMVVGRALQGEEGEPMREKLDAVMFGWFYPFFFVGTGIRFNVASLGQDLTTVLLVPAFATLLLIIRGVPVLLYRNELARAERLPFALSAAVPSLSVVVVITSIGVAVEGMSQDIADALIGAALLSTMLFPTLADALLSRARTSPEPLAPAQP